jgi:hypothetical protein
MPASLLAAHIRQLMESLVPLYASLVAALHISVHHDIGSYLLESLTLKLMEVTPIPSFGLISMPGNRSGGLVLAAISSGACPHQ